MFQRLLGLAHQQQTASPLSQLTSADFRSTKTLAVGEDVP